MPGQEEEGGAVLSLRPLSEDPEQQGVLPAPLSVPCAPQHLLKCSLDVVKRAG